MYILDCGFFKALEKFTRLRKSNNKSLELQCTIYLSRLVVLHNYVYITHSILNYISRSRFIQIHNFYYQSEHNAHLVAQIYGGGLYPNVDIVNQRETPTHPTNRSRKEMNYIYFANLLLLKFLVPHRRAKKGIIDFLWFSDLKWKHIVRSVVDLKVI